DTCRRGIARTDSQGSAGSRRVWYDDGRSSQRRERVSEELRVVPWPAPTARYAGSKGNVSATAPAFHDRRKRDRRSGGRHLLEGKKWDTANRHAGVPGYARGPGYVAGNGACGARGQTTSRSARRAEADGSGAFD